MIKNNGLPFFHKIETIEGNSIYLNPSNIDKIEYHSVNSNWCEVFLNGVTDPLILRISPEELLEQLINSYKEFLARL